MHPGNLKELPDEFQKAFKPESSSNSIQVPGVTLFGGYAGLSLNSLSVKKVYKLPKASKHSSFRAVSILPGDLCGRRMISILSEVLTRELQPI